MIETGDDESANVIVMYRAKKGAEAPEFDAGDRVSRRQNVRLKAHFGHTGASAGRLSRKEIERLAADPDVEYIAPDEEVAAFGVDRGPESVGAYAAQSSGWNGRGIGVAVIDSGVSYGNCNYSSNSTCDNNNRYVAQLSFVNNLSGSWNAPDDGQDYFGHGTHVAGIIGGSGVFSTNYVNQWNIFPTYNIRGVAPQINLVSLRVLDSSGRGRDSSVIAAIDWAIGARAQFNIRVMNLSLGRPVSGSFRNDPLCQAVERAWKAGIVVVVAAGNYGRINNGGNRGYGTISSPGNSPFVITVGAVNTYSSTDRRQHKVTSYSSKGPSAIDRILKPDLVAPGNQIFAPQCVECPMTSTYTNNRIWATEYATIPAGAGNSNNHYLRLSGTSMAAPMVSGAVALLLQKSPSLTPDQVKARLMKTATKGSFVAKYNAVDASNNTSYSISHDIFTVGAGLLNVQAALSSTDTITSGRTAESPAVAYDSATKKVRLVRSNSVVWGENIVWGESVVWGSGLVSGTTILWGENIVWGENTISGFSVVWGSTSPVAATGTALASTSSSPTIHGDR